MKKLIRYGVVCIMAFTLLSCGSNKKAKDLAELKTKYEGKTFNDCDKFITAYKEVMDVYFQTLDKAIDGDEAALKDFSDFDYFISDFSKNATPLAETCPEKFEKFGEELGNKMMENLPKLMSLYGGQLNDLGGGEGDIEVEELIDEEIIDIE